MALRTIKTNQIKGLGAAISGFGSDDDVLVAQDVLVLSTEIIESEGRGIKLLFNDHDLEIRGTVVGCIGVELGGDSISSVGNTTKVTSTGHVIGSVDGALLRGSFSLNNAGKIEGDNVGLRVMVDGTSKASVVNTGTIVGDVGIKAAIDSDQTATVEVANYGTIKGAGAYHGSSNMDSVTNRGTMIGGVGLGWGDDKFDNFGGTVYGKILLGDGTDIFKAGDSAETVDGGKGTDTLDFQKSTGVTINLATGTGTGSAAYDIYSGFERVLGSSTGADVLVGDGAANTLKGLGGVDVLKGGDGNDSLVGGPGKDTLTGGWNDDVFVFASISEAGDTITDFGTAYGNNDLFQIDVSGFALGSVAPGAMDASAFRLRANSNTAGDSNDRFIVRDSDDTLWFDRDGTGSAYSSQLVADLHAGATVTAADFWLVA